MKRSLIIFLVMLFFGVPLTPLLGAPTDTAEQIESQLSAKQSEIARLEAEIAEFRKQIEAKRGQATSLSRSIAILEQEVKKINTTISSLRAALDEIRLKTQKTVRSIKETETEITRRTDLLGEQMRAIDAFETESGVVAMMFSSVRLSDLLDQASDLATLQEKTESSVQALVALERDLESKKQDLEEQEKERLGLLAIQRLEQEEAQRKSTERRRALDDAKKQEKTLTQRVEASKKLVESLKNDIYALQRVGVTIEDAIKFGELVANRAGIRPAFLIALLEVESRLGLNVGKGTWKKDMNPNQFDAFRDITSRLGLDPDTTPVSKKPSYGWGGAMGPAQFLPGTWLGYEAKISALTGHNPPSPWNIEDAFMAAAIKLANDGATAKTRAGELRAANQYISGNPNCTKSICNYYSNLVLDKAAAIEEKLKAE